jgi:hypothetical protein
MRDTALQTNEQRHVLSMLSQLLKKRATNGVALTFSTSDCPLGLRVWDVDDGNDYKVSYKGVV